MTDREKLIEIIRCANKTHEENKEQWILGGKVGERPSIIGSIADHLLANGVTFVTDNNDGCKRIEELEAQLAEREKVVIQLRKQWQDAEMHICTMCGHFDHKTDGNIVYGNMTCGEICGYPFCKEKFTPWIPVTERLPEDEEKVLALSKSSWSDGYLTWLIRYNHKKGAFYDYDAEWGDIKIHNVTHWMPLPNPPEEENNEA